MPKQTRASTNYRNRRSVVPPAAPRGLNQEIGTAEFVQETGDSARTAFVGPFQGGTQGEEEKEPGGERCMGRPQGGDQRVGENRGPHGEFPTRLPARLIRQDAVRNDQVQLCVWGEEGSLNIFWERLSYLCRASTIVDHVTKVVRVWQECKARIRFDIWVTSAYVATFLGKMEPGKARYGWYFRHHIPYLERVGPILAPAAAGAQINPPGSPMPTIPPDGFGAPLVVGTLNINGLQRKKTDLRFLLQQTRCDVMAVQETLLRSTDWQLRLPGYHCLTAMGDLTASQRGVALLVSTKFNCTPVGKATPFWTFARVYSLWGHPLEAYSCGNNLCPMQSGSHPSAQGPAPSLGRSTSGVSRRSHCDDGRLQHEDDGVADSDGTVAASLSGVTHPRGGLHSPMPAGGTANTCH